MKSLFFLLSILNPPPPKKKIAQFPTNFLFYSSAFLNNIFFYFTSQLRVYLLSYSLYCKNMFHSVPHFAYALIKSCWPRNCLSWWEIAKICWQTTSSLLWRTVFHFYSDSLTSHHLFSVQHIAPNLYKLCQLNHCIFICSFHISGCSTESHRKCRVFQNSYGISWNV